MLCVGYLLVVTVVAVLRSGANVGAAVPAMVVPSERFEPLRGRVRQAPGVVVLEQPDPAGVAIVSARTTPFAAAIISR